MKYAMNIFSAPAGVRLGIATLCACGGLVISMPASSQVERPSASQAGGGPGGAPGGGGGMGGGRAQQSVKPPDPAVAADPRDFSGTWKTEMTGGAAGAGGGAGAGMGAGPAPVAGMGAGAPGGAPAASQGASGGKSSGLMCIPDKSIYAGGGGGGLEFIHTANQITMVSEENHRVRRIYLNAEHPKSVKPSYMGHSVGHWEDDTLVIETVGLRNSPGMSTIERIRKIDNGLGLEVKISNKDGAGKISEGRPVSLRWDPTPLAEWICEDYTDEFFKEDYGK